MHFVEKTQTNLAFCFYKMRNAKFYFVSCFVLPKQQRIGKRDGLGEPPNQ